MIFANVGHIIQRRLYIKKSIKSMEVWFLYEKMILLLLLLLLFDLLIEIHTKLLFPTNNYIYTQCRQFTTRHNCVDTTTSLSTS